MTIEMRNKMRGVKWSVCGGAIYFDELLNKRVALRFYNSDDFTKRLKVKLAGRDM